MFYLSVWLKAGKYNLNIDETYSQFERRREVFERSDDVLIDVIPHCDLDDFCKLEMYIRNRESTDALTPEEIKKALESE